MPQRNKHIDALVNRGDWESLIRYWMSFRSGTALDAAAELVGAKAKKSRDWEPFQEYLRKIAKGFAPSTVPVFPSQSSGELITVEMIPLHLCYLSSRENRWSHKRTAKEIEEGIAAAKKALVLSDGLTPTDTALTARFVTHIGVGLSRLDCLPEAEEWFKKALKLYDEVAKTSPDECQITVARILGNLSLIHSSLGRDEQAIECLESAIKANANSLITGDDKTVFEDRMQFHEKLGNLLLGTHIVPNFSVRRRAFEHFGKACRASEELRSTIGSGGLREEEENQMFLLFARHVENSVRAWNQLDKGNPEKRAFIIEAVWASEAVRSRQFLDRVVRDRVRAASREGKAPAGSDNPQTASTVFISSTLQSEADDLDDLADRRNPIRIAFNKPKKARSNSDTASSQDDKMEYLNALVAEAKKCASDLNFLSVPGEAQPPVFDALNLRDLVPNDKPSAIVQFTYTTLGLHAFIISKEGSEEYYDVWTETKPDWLPALMRNWLLGQHNSVMSLQAALRANANPFSSLASCNAGIESACQILGKRLLEPIVKRLPKGVERLVIVPHMFLHLFPFHACPVSNNQPLGDAFEIIYAPSLSIFQRCGRLPQKQNGKGLIVRPPGNLQFTAAECEAIKSSLAGILKVDYLTASSASTEDVVQAAISDCRVFHYSGHANFDFENPAESSLRLCGAKLTLSEVLYRIKMDQNCLTVIAGCEGAVSFPNLLDEVHSFSTGFLLAGARCVIGTLWSVPDFPSALLLDHFYQLWTRGSPPADALRQAQKWLRSLRAGEELRKAGTLFAQKAGNLPEVLASCLDSAGHFEKEFGELPFASPLNWAGFVCSGAGHLSP